MPSYYFAYLGLIPDSLPPLIETPSAAVHRREWEISAFDFATLGAYHTLHFSWHLLEVLMHSCHLEIEIRGAKDLSEAKRKASVLQAMLYVEGISPFVMPVIMTNGLRDYSGINYCDSEALRQKLPDDLQTGFVSADGKIEGWLHEPSLQIVGAMPGNLLSEQSFLAAAAKAETWSRLEREYPRLEAARLAFQTAPLIPDLPSSLLHLWQGIEGLFPQVSSEVSFRLALFISQLCEPVEGDRMDTSRTAKHSYKMRSNAAHGNGHRIDMQSWKESWHLLALCLSSCIKRKNLPSEDMLTQELLA